MTVKIAALATVMMLGACASNPNATDAGGIFDPYEAQNRKIHAFNRSLDKAIVRPAAKGYTTILPDEVEDSVGRFASNLGEPSVVVNSLLQGDLKGAGLATLRFATNTVLGLGGLFDAAEALQMPEHETDFGETLYKWGVGEGPYIELPALGPSTARNATGKVVDLFTNPLSYVLPSPEKYYGTAAGAASRLSDRGRYSEIVDGILYESADSYAQAQLIFMQNRRFKLGQEDPSAENDPFALDTEGF